MIDEHNPPSARASPPTSAQSKEVMSAAAPGFHIWKGLDDTTFPAATSIDIFGRVSHGFGLADADDVHSFSLSPTSLSALKKIEIKIEWFKLSGKVTEEIC